MRTFILALIVFALIIGTLILTGVYLTRRTHELSASARALPELSDHASDNSAFYAAAKEFNELWTSTRKTIHFIIGHEEADRIEDTFADLQARYLKHDTAGYTSAREKLLRSIERLADSEAFSFDSVT